MLNLFVIATLASVTLARMVDFDREQSMLGYGNLRKKMKHQNLLASSHATTCENVDELWFGDAVQDNFAPINYQKKWEGKGQRYFENKEFWGGKGHPIFVFIGGEGQESCSRLTDRMYVYDLAKEHNALMLDVEHRFYGESYPTKGMTTKDLSLLSSEQALADLARLLTWYMKENDTAESKIITVGGSYPGNLSGWFRLKYPSITFGSIASSAPVTAKTNFYEYMDVVAQSIDYFDETHMCNTQLASAAQTVADLVRSGDYNKLSTDFKTCAPLESRLDISTFMSVLMGNIQGVVQYNNEGSGLNVSNVCSTMTADLSTPYDSFMKVNDEVMAQYGMECNDVAWNSTVDILSSTVKDPNNNMRPWTYQTCNEFGYYQTADSDKQPFYAFKDWLGLEYSRIICAAAFDGWKALPEVDFTNEQYGALNVAATNVLWPSGTIDPWHALGITNSTGTLPQPSERPVYIEGTAHCADLYAPNAYSDPQSLTDARQIIANQVAAWLV